MSLHLGWQSLSFSNVSQSCLDSPYFEALPDWQGAYCAFKAPLAQIAQMCCNHLIQEHPQDQCTFICPEIRGKSLRDCLSVVYDVNMTTNTYYGIVDPSTTHTFQMICYNGQGNLLPNITALHNGRYLDTSSVSLQPAASTTAQQIATQTSDAPFSHGGTSGVPYQYVSNNNSLDLTQPRSSAGTTRLSWLSVAFCIMLVATVNT